MEGCSELLLHGKTVFHKTCGKVVLFFPQIHSSLHCAVAGRQWIDRLDRTLSHLSDARVEDVPAGW